jgi:hypothetical protein
LCSKPYWLYNEDHPLIWKCGVLSNAYSVLNKQLMKEEIKRNNKAKKIKKEIANKSKEIEK